MVRVAIGFRGIVMVREIIVGFIAFAFSTFLLFGLSFRLGLRREVIPLLLVFAFPTVCVFPLFLRMMSLTRVMIVSRAMAIILMVMALPALSIASATIIAFIVVATGIPRASISVFTVLSVTFIFSVREIEFGAPGNVRIGRLLSTPLCPCSAVFIFIGLVRPVVSISYCDISSA